MGMEPSGGYLREEGKQNKRDGLSVLYAARKKPFGTKAGAGGGIPEVSFSTRKKKKVLKKR